MVGHIRSEWDHCAVLAGLGWGRGSPACVLYEANGLDVYQLKATDTPDGVVQRIGAGRTIYLIPANELPTIEIEKQFVHSFASVPGDSYFKINTTHRNLQGKKIKGWPQHETQASLISRGEYILPLDADNRLRSGYFEHGIRILDSNSQIGVVYGDAEYIGMRTGRWHVRPGSVASMELH
jgi:hypothetical protein